MLRKYQLRSYVGSHILPAEGETGDELEIEIDLNGNQFLNIMARAVYQNTHASTSGIAFTGRYGMKDINGDIVYDMSTAPVNFGSLTVTLNQSAETIGTLQFKVPVNDVPSHLKLKAAQLDTTHGCVLDIFGCT